jgi:hypothetical protein
LAFHSADNSAEVRFRIPIAAFAAERVLLQDGPDVCYQRLARMLAAGEAPGREVIAIDDAELAAYREAHARPPRRPASPQAPPKRAPSAARIAASHPKLPVAAPLPVAMPEPGFDPGQRVHHSVFGEGVTVASRGGRTSVRFDDHGVRTFVTSMLKAEALSAPHEWEPGPSGENRLRDVEAAPPATRKRRA